MAFDRNKIYLSCFLESFKVLKVYTVYQVREEIVALRNPCWLLFALGKNFAECQQPNWEYDKSIEHSIIIMGLPFWQNQMFPFSKKKCLV